MTRRTWKCLTGAAVALGMAGLPAIAQNQSTTRSTTRSTTVTQTTTYGSYDSSLPTAIPDEMTRAAARRIVDLNLSAKDCEMAINRLRLIAEDQAALDAAADQRVWRTLLRPEGDTNAPPAEMTSSRANIQAAWASAWDMLSSDIGADKAQGLRAISYPGPTNTQWVAYIDERGRTIDSLLADLDRQLAAGPSTSVATTTTTTTTTTSPSGTSSTVTTASWTANPPPPFTASYQPQPYISVPGMIRLLEVRLNALRPSWENLGDEDLNSYRLHNPTTRFDLDKVGIVDRPPSAYETAKQKMMKVWD